MTNTIRAKVRLAVLLPFKDAEGKTTQERWTFAGVSAKAYDAEGNDEDNTFAKYTPSLNLEMMVQNPMLLGKFKPNDVFYMDFTPVPEEGQ